MITSCVRQKIRDLFVDGVDVCAVSAKQFNNLSLRGAQRRSTSDGQVKRSFQLVVSGIDQRSVIQQQLNHLQISGLAGEVQCASSSSKASATCVAAFDEAVVVMAWNFGVVVRSRPILHTHTHTESTHSAPWPCASTHHKHIIVWSLVTKHCAYECHFEGNACVRRSHCRKAAGTHGNGFPLLKCLRTHYG